MFPGQCTKYSVDVNKYQGYGTSRLKQRRRRCEGKPRSAFRLGLSGKQIPLVWIPRTAHETSVLCRKVQLDILLSDEHLPREQALLLGVRSTSEFEYLYPAVQSLLVLLDVL